MTPQDSAPTQPRQSAPSALSTPQPATRPALVFGVVALALLMSSLDQTIVATALGTLQRDLDASITWVGWTMTAYSLGLVLMLPVAGTLSQRYGRRRIFLLSVVLFSGASLCCGLADNIYVLVALRFLQAVGGAGFTPSATGLIVEHFGKSRDKAVGLFGSIFSIGAMIGPIFGGLFVSYWSWRGIFFVNVPIGVLLIVLCLRFIPRDASRAHAPQAGFDFLGMAQLGIGLLGAMLALNALSAGAGAFREPEFLVPTAVAIVSLVLFARHTRDAAHPLIPARFIAGRGFAAANMVSMVYGGMVAGVVALVPLYATARYGISALGSGTLLIAEGAAVIIMSTLGALTLRRTGYRLPIYVGAIVMAIGTCMLALNPRGMSPYAWLATAACLIGLGAGWSSPASRNAGLQLAPESAPTLAARRSMTRQLGAIAAISITTAMVAGASSAGTAHAYAYLMWAAILVLAIPVIARIPEHRGAW
ncbi:MAG: MFS transporter [Burkholderiaceae bacterium]